MKKIYAVFTVLVLFCCTVFVSVASVVNSDKEKVEIKKNLLYGDKSAAEGLEITTLNHMGYKLYWETDYTIGENSSPRTDFSLYPGSYQQERTKHEYTGVEITNGIEHGFDEKLPASKQEGIAKAYKELADSTGNGEAKDATVFLKDYYDYYPLSLWFDLPGTNWAGDTASSDSLKGEPYDGRYVLEKFREYFKIPVSESDKAYISVEKDKDGNVNSTYSDDTGCSVLRSVSAVAEKRNRCFFTFSNLNYTDGGYKTSEYFDTSLIPGEYGIYSFYYCGGKSAANTGILADKIETVYPLDKNTEVKHMSLNGDNTRLLLFTEEKQSLYLTVIDTDTMSKLQKIRLAGSPSAGIYEYDDFLVADTENSIAVVSVADGVYSLDFNIEKSYFPDDNYRYLYDIDSMDYKNGKLAVIGNKFEENSGYKVCDFIVFVYDKSGLLFCGVYDNSLDFDRENIYFNKDCYPADTNANKISWK